MKQGRQASAFSMSPYDLWGEGPAVAVGRCHDLGVDGISLASVYHAGRDVFPHNPTRRVRFLDADAAFFRPDLTRYGAIRPRVSDAVATNGDALELAREETAARGMALSAWVVVCHNEEQSETHPAHAIRNVFGDPYQTSLCPSSPLVHEYARALVSDVLRYECDTVALEAVHFPGFAHGHHHERSFAVRSEDVEELLGTCFCSHCERIAMNAGVDLTSLARHLMPWLDRALNAADPMHAAEEAWWPEFEAFLTARRTAITTLLRAVDDVRTGEKSRLVVVDDNASVPHTAPVSRAPLELALRAGLDLSTLEGLVDGVVLPVGYDPDPSALRSTVTGYGAALGQAELHASLRPLSPGCPSAATLAEQVRTVFDLGADSVSFYHYGFLPIGVLEWVREALEGARRSSIRK